MKIIYNLLFILAFCSIASAQDHIVIVQSNTFTPNVLNINVGESVLFDNIDGFHNVNGTQTDYPSNPESFGNGGATSAPWVYEHTFTAVGTYQYHCDPHLALGMSGTIIVSGGASNNEDVVINEIMYNPPEGGVDSLEYIELYNKGNAAVDLSGWTFTAGVMFTFPDATTIDPGGYVVTAVNSAAMQTVFGISTLQWTSGGLSNGGEVIELSDANGTVVDMVNFDDGNGWPTEPDGFGSSLVLCDATADNSMASSWLSADTGTGYLIDDTEVFANPGAASGCPDNAFVRFINSSVNVDEAVGTITAQVSLAFGDANPTSVDVVLDAASTATDGADFNFTATTLTFSGGVANDTMEVTISITDDMDIEVLETVVLSLENVTNDAEIIAAGQSFTASIADNDTPLVDLFFTEIMYNDPTGPDTLEFVEIYNNEAEAVDLTGFSITQGFNFNFPDGAMVGAGEFVYIAKNGAFFEEVFGTPAYTWTSGSLTNTGEDVEISDASGNMLNNVNYDDGGDWPIDPDGFGATLALCDFDTDNSLAASWGSSSEATGVLLEGVEILASINSSSVCQIVLPPSYPNLPIGVVSTVNSTGVVDSINVTCTLTGVVLGIDLNGGEGVQFFIHDGNDGIGVFQGAPSDYVVTEGDEVTIEGRIGQFNGLTQINPESIVMNSAGNDLPNFIENPTVLNEDTEGELVLFENAWYVDETQWQPAGSGFTMEIYDQNGNIQVMFIDNDSEMFQLSEAPNSLGGIRVAGIGGQYDTSSPFDEGYQFVPRYIEDFDFYGSTLDASLAEKINIYPNPAQDLLNIMTEDVTIDNIRITNVLGQIILDIENPSNQLNISSLAAGVYTITFTSGESIYAEQLVKK